MKAEHRKNLVQPLTRQAVCSALDRPPREYADMRPSVPGSLPSNGQDSGIRCQSCQATGQDIPAGRRGLRTMRTSRFATLSSLHSGLGGLARVEMPANVRYASCRELVWKLGDVMVIAVLLT